MWDRRYYIEALSMVELPSVRIGSLSPAIRGNTGVVASVPRQVSGLNISGYQPQQICDTVQRSRWFGWENMATNCSGFAYLSFDDVTASYDCIGTGTHNFNGAANGWAQGSVESPEDDSPSAPQFSC